LHYGFIYHAVGLKINSNIVIKLIKTVAIAVAGGRYNKEMSIKLITASIELASLQQQVF
jgi:hypothetical protein